MENQDHETKSQSESAGAVAISYRGADAKTEAESINKGLRTSGLEIEPPSEVGRDEALLGASEIIITIILAPIAKAAAKAVITTAFTFLQDYFAERVAMKDADLNVQLVV